MEKDKTVPRFVKLKDRASGEELFYPEGFEQSVFESALRYRAKDSDVFVCSYAKTGTTWLQNIVWLLVHRGEEIPADLNKYTPMLEFEGAEYTESIDDTDFARIIKTHFPHKMVPKNAKAKYLYITRNPKDAFTSYFFHVKGFSTLYGTENLDINKLYDLYMKGEAEFNSYFDHINVWYEHRSDANVLFLLYEDVKQDPRKEILKIAKFLGKEFEDAVKAENEKLVETIIKLSSFSHMKSRNIWHTSPRASDQPFIRKGQIGDWKNHLTAEQAAGLDRALAERCKESGACHLWDKYAELL